MISIILGQIMAQNKHFENGQILILKKCFWHYQLKLGKYYLILWENLKFDYSLFKEMLINIIPDLWQEQYKRY